MIRRPRPQSGVMPGAPLTALLSWAWVAFTIEADNAAEAAGAEQVGRLFRISLPMWANGLRFIGEEGITAGELRVRARAACNIGGLERWGWITVGDAEGGRRDGGGVTGSLRDALRRYAGRMPSAPPGVHPSDGFRTHVVEGPASAEDGELAGLLGQALTSVTLGHEQDSPVSLPVAALPWHPMVLHRGGWPDGS